MAITLKNLVWADTKEDQQTICLEELRCVGPISFSREHEGHTIDVVLSEISVTQINGQDVLTLIATVQRDGADVEVDNPLLYLNPPICVPDGTFSDVDGKQVANYIESPYSAMEVIVFGTLKATALKS